MSDTQRAARQIILKRKLNLNFKEERERERQRDRVIGKTLRSEQKERETLSMRKNNTERVSKRE